ncbi:MAG TPA: HAD-IIIA family hydrolase, partial [Candidatus Ozemobacteraceae bacterium]|nr:HAD-IIIA family hydrolase [Candidatus Ozemobacteraceae bacterium]
APSANTATDVALLPMLEQAMQRIASEGYLIAIVSNQAGVAAGYLTLEQAEAAMQTTVCGLASRGIAIHYYDYADQKDENRKPDIGMAKRLAEMVQKKFNRGIDWANSFMVGDSAWKKGVDNEPDGRPGEDGSNNDRLFAENLKKTYGGVTFHHARDFFGWKAAGANHFNDYATLKSWLEKNAGSAKRWKAVPSMAIDPAKTCIATLKTSLGTIRVEPLAKESPNTVNNFVFLARQGFYDGTIFHRIIKDFMIQGGDPLGTGEGDPGYSFADELPAKHSYEPGIMAMANAGPNTQGSQFFICNGTKAKKLDTRPNYTQFGRVIEGMDVVLKISSVEVGPGENGELSKPASPPVLHTVTIEEK